jgi:hypothetical protein
VFTVVVDNIVNLHCAKGETIYLWLLMSPVSVAQMMHERIWGSD